MRTGPMRMGRLDDILRSTNRFAFTDEELILLIRAVESVECELVEIPLGVNLLMKLKRKTPADAHRLDASAGAAGT